MGSPPINEELVLMEKGKMYRVRYVLQSGNYQWYEWECTSVYLGRGDLDDEVFSSRPLGGTGSIPVKQILGVKEVSQAEGPKLPRRLPGAVEAPTP